MEILLLFKKLIIAFERNPLLTFREFVETLVSEIMTLALQEVSDHEWSESDFEGHIHSDLLSKAINDVTTAIDPFYHQLRTTIISHQVANKQAPQQPIANPPSH